MRKKSVMILLGLVVLTAGVSIAVMLRHSPDRGNDINRLGYNAGNTGSNRPFRIIRVPMPSGLYQEAGEGNKIPVRSYLNYALTNGAVIMQTHWRAGRPAALKTTEEQVMGLFGPSGRTAI
jgi:hypothetical protein